MKILVTGAAGFIGFHLSKRLLEDGVTLIGVDNLNDYYDVNLKKERLNQLNKIAKITKSNFIFSKVNLQDEKEINTIFKKYLPEKVVNLAAQAGVRFSIENPYAYIQSNLVGFANILESCRNYNIKHLVYASSSSVYGGNTNMPFSENNEPIKVFNNGEMVRDFTFIDDVVESIIRILDKPAIAEDTFNTNDPNPSSSWAPHKVFNIGNSSPTHLIEYIQAIEDELGMKAKKMLLPMQPGDVAATESDSSQLQKWINYKPNTTIKEGIKKFIIWYRGFYEV